MIGLAMLPRNLSKFRGNIEPLYPLSRHGQGRGSFSGGTAVAYVSKISLASNLAISFLENKQSCEKTASFSLMFFLFYCYLLFFVLVGNSLIWLIPIISFIEFFSEVLFMSIVYWRRLICLC